MTYSDEYARLIAQSYDSVYAVVRDPAGDVDFYVEQATRFGGPVLELGCGTGRILLPTARTGLRCVGLDASAAMLAVLKAKDPPANVELVTGRMESCNLGERFQLVTAPFRAFQHMLDVESQLQALENVKRHLAPGGAFVFDVFDPKLERMAVLYEPEDQGIGFQHQGYQMRRFETLHRDLSTQIMTVKLRFAGGPPELTGTVEIQMRWFYRYEIEHLLARAGFTNLTFYGGFHGNPWNTGKDIVVVAKA